jgi:hypothetical protein
MELVAIKGNTVVQVTYLSYTNADLAYEILEQIAKTI